MSYLFIYTLQQEMNVKHDAALAGGFSQRAVCAWLQRNNLQGKVKDG